MKSSKGISVLFGGVSLATVAFFTVLLSGGILGSNTAEANQPPPPPTSYTLTVTAQGGDSTCEVRIDMPEESAWTSTSVQDSFPPYTEYAPTHQVNCPSEYGFVRWESAEDSDLHGWRENRNPDFELTQNTTAIAKFEHAGFTKPPEHGITISGAAGSNYGAVVRLIYENAAGWMVKETVQWAASEPSGFTDCIQHIPITQQPNYVPLNRCDLDGTPNPNGAHGSIDDSIMNSNGPPWMLLDVFTNNGKSFPCSSTTDQVTHLRPNPCFPPFDYPHEQRVSLWNIDSDNGGARGWSSGVGGITTDWTRP